MAAWQTPYRQALAADRARLRRRRLEPVVLLVVAALPGNAVLAGNRLVGLADAQALHAADLLDRLVPEDRAGEAFLIHAIDHSQALGFVGIEPSLVEQATGTEGAAGAVGVKADAILADPGQQAVVGGQGFDGGVGDGAARAEHDQAELVDRHGSVAGSLWKIRPAASWSRRPRSR